MEDIAFTDQSPAALRLALVEGDFDRTQFPSLVSASYHYEGITVEASVIGASHMIGFHTMDLELNEVFACKAPRRVSSRLLKEMDGQAIVRFFPHMRYEFRAGLQAWEFPEPVAVQEIAIAAAGNGCDGIGLVYDFPAGDLVAVPKTVVNVWPCPEGVLTATIHSYPEQGFVWSLSALTYTD